MAEKSTTGQHIVTAAFLLLQIFNMALQVGSSAPCDSKVLSPQTRNSHPRNGSNGEHSDVEDEESIGPSSCRYVKFQLQLEQKRSAELETKLKREMSNCLVRDGTSIVEHFYNSTSSENIPFLPEIWRREFWKFTSQKSAEAALFEGAKSGDTSLVRWLVDIGTNANALNGDSLTPLHVAADTGYVDVIRTLLKRKAFLSPKDKWQWTPLHYCAWKGHFDACTLLLESGATVNAITDDGRTPLHKSAQENSCDVTSLLLDYGANPNARDKWQWTPLFYSAWNGHLDVCKTLVERGAHVNVESRDKDWGGKPLTYAYKNQHKTVADYLIGKGAAP